MASDDPEFEEKAADIIGIVPVIFHSFRRHEETDRAAHSDVEAADVSGTAETWFLKLLREVASWKAMCLRLEMLL